MVNNVETGTFYIQEGSQDCPGQIDLTMNNQSFAVSNQGYYVANIYASINLPEGALMSDLECLFESPNNTYEVLASVEQYLTVSSSEVISSSLLSTFYTPLANDNSQTAWSQAPYLLLNVQGAGPDFCASQLDFLGCNLTVSIVNFCANDGTPAYVNGEMVCDCADGFSGPVCENTPDTIALLPEDFSTNPDNTDWGSYGNGVFSGDCSYAADFMAEIDFSYLLNVGDQIENISCSFCYVPLCDLHKDL